VSPSAEVQQRTRKSVSEGMDVGWNREFDVVPCWLPKSALGPSKTVREYYEDFFRRVVGQEDARFSAHVAAEVAAAYSIGPSFEQLQSFLARRKEITSVAVAPESPLLGMNEIERMIEALQAGAIYPKEVLVRAITASEIRDRYNDQTLRGHAK